MAKFKSVYLKDICNFEKGSTGLAKAIPGKYPLVNTGAIRRTCESFQFDIKAVCIPLVSSTGHGHASLKNVHYQEGKFALGTILVALTAKDQNVLDIQFLHLYLFQFKNLILVPLMSGAANVTLSMTKIKNIEIPLPPIEKQKKIVSQFRGIEIQEKELKTELIYQQTLLKKLRQHILQEAIEGKLSTDWRQQNPNIEPARKLLARIHAERTQLIKDKKIKKGKPWFPIREEEKLFELPVGWIWCRIGETIEQLTDYHANGSYKKLKQHVNLLDNPDYAIMLRTTNFHKNSKKNYKYITKNAYEFLAKSKVFPGDVIMNKIADPGATFYVDDRGQPMSLAMNLFLLRFSKNNIDSKFAYYYLYASYDYVVSFSSGTATPTITKDAVKSLRFPLPPLSEQKAIVTKVEKLLSICNLLENQITANQTHAEMLMQSVLQEAFSQTPEQPEQESKKESLHA